MDLRTTEADRLAGPLWFERWGALRRRQDRALLGVAAGLVGVLLPSLRLGSSWRVVLVVLLGATSIYCVLARLRMRALAPLGEAAVWLQEWKRKRRHLQAYGLLAFVVLLLGAWAVAVWSDDAHGWWSVGLLVVGAVLTLFFASILVGVAVKAGAQAQGLVPAASDADVLERWRREDDAAERAEVAALKAQQRVADRERRRQARRQESCLRQARVQALRRGPLLRRELVVPIRGTYVPLEELERNVRSGYWRISQVEPDHRTVHHAAEYGRHSNPLLGAAGHQERKRSAWDERIPLPWNILIQEL